MADTLAIQLNKALDRLVKWQSIFAGWQLGTRHIDEGGELAAVRDHIDITLNMQTELAALRKILRVDPALYKDAADLEPNNILEGVRAHRATTLVMRAELNALLRVLVEDKVIAIERFQAAMLDEVQLAQQNLERRFPGARATDNGMVLTPEFQKTMAFYKFPP